jgi:FAD/FMN-containing dehydrogenase
MTAETATTTPFPEDFSGEVFTPQQEGYEQARAIWNGQITKRPALIARCRDAADVQRALRFAREGGLEVSVRGGGHAVAGHALTDDGVVVDLSAMTGVQVDPDARTARVQGGALWSDVDRETQAHGLAVTGGIVTHTGVAGLTLGGGLGHLMRVFGLSIDSLRSCEVVTADGELLTADERRHPELFWGLRGGGGNFGIVTSFEFTLHPLGPSVLAGMLAYPMDQAPELLRRLRDFTAGAPDELGLYASLRLAPALPAVPEHLHGQPIVALVVCYAGAVEDGWEVLRPLLESATPAVDTVMAKPYVAHQAMFDPAFPHGRHYYWRSWKVPPLSDPLIDTIVEHASGITSPFSTVGIFTQGGAVARVPDEATAYPGRDAAHDVNIVGAWAPEDPEPDRHVRWVRDFWEALRPHGRGVYVNFLSDDPQGAVESAYGPEKYARLVALKTRYDPDNVFHLNHNIPPAGGPAGRGHADA